ncbi:hypothetical protein U91I_01351 [alpha proteobacterium U9-1i]|nr:hypothetical protein U91I_01351 [alpha proteobacterium U9-1i]
MAKRVLFAVLLAGFAVASAHAQRPQACAGAEFRQFDFWVGAWEITPRNAEQPTGRSTITLSQDGCVIVEAYSAASGNGAVSLSGYDARRGVWRQTWSSSTGSTAYLEGGVHADGAMELTDRGQPWATATGAMNRVRWRADADGAVWQSWEISRDGGITWTAIFDDRYVRR